MSTPNQYVRVTHNATGSRAFIGPFPDAAAASAWVPRYKAISSHAHKCGFEVCGEDEWRADLGAPLFAPNSHMHA